MASLRLHHRPSRKISRRVVLPSEPGGPLAWLGRAVGFGSLSPTAAPYVGAALLAAVLPNPIKRKAGKPSKRVQAIASRIQARMAGMDAYLTCIAR